MDELWTEPSSSCSGCRTPGLSADTGDGSIQHPVAQPPTPKDGEQEVIGGATQSTSQNDIMSLDRHEEEHCAERFRN